MATIFNKRQHNLSASGVTLKPGENTVEDEVWEKASVAGSQFETWTKLNWIAQKRGLPVSKEASKDMSKPGAVFSAPSVDSPVSQEPGGDMNPGAHSASHAAAASSHTAKDLDTDDAKRGRLRR